MTCVACQAAETNPRTGLTCVGCIDCQARMLAQSPGAFQRESDHAELLISDMRKLRPLESEYRELRRKTWAWINRFSGRSSET